MGGWQVSQSCEVPWRGRLVIAVDDLDAAAQEFHRAGMTAYGGVERFGDGSRSCTLIVHPGSVVMLVEGRARSIALIEATRER